VLQSSAEMLQIQNVHAKCVFVKHVLVELHANVATAIAVTHVIAKQLGPHLNVRPLQLP